MTPSHQHYAIEDTTHSPQKQWLPHLLNGSHKLQGLEDKRGVLFSNSVLETYIQEEEKLKFSTFNSIRFWFYNSNLI
ncbi:hypothetical protein [Winogradskyella sp.]|uniref:hypothetical protein n=1 Tax=Winogradskyella sp. TaxID=1883156 RepID=UPI003AB8021F